METAVLGLLPDVLGEEIPLVPVGRILDFLHEPVVLEEVEDLLVTQARENGGAVCRPFPSRSVRFAQSGEEAPGGLDVVTEEALVLLVEDDGLGP